jgi:hypothetical protein
VYDVHGNVKILAQQTKKFFGVVKLLEYNYDLVSGKVNEVVYQRGQWDELRRLGAANPKGWEG